VSDLSKRVETDVSVFRLRLAPVADGSVVFGWDYPGSTLLRVRILRTAAAPAPENSVAAAPAPDARAPWQLVYDGDTGSCRDRAVSPGRAYRYAVFARNGTGPWALWRDEVVAVPVLSTP
jgi:hypothetical protein